MNPSALFDLTGKTALVTGGATGIGKMAAHGLASAGAKVFIASRKVASCEQTTDELNSLGLKGEVDSFAGDVASEEGVTELVADLKQRTDQLDVLMNNAGTTWGKELGKFPHSAWEKVNSVNLAGMFELTQQLLPLLRNSGNPDDPSRIINVGSVMGEVPLGDGAYSYAVSKAGVHHMTRILAKEIAHQHITVNALAPGPFVSNMTAFVTADEKRREAVAQDIPLGRVGQPDDIAACMLFLCGKGGSYITGAIIPVSGGINVMTGPSLFGRAQSIKS